LFVTHPVHDAAANKNEYTMKSGLNPSWRALMLASLLVTDKHFAAENDPTTNIRNSLPAPSAHAASFAENPGATDAAPPLLTNAAPPAALPLLPTGVTELKFSEFFRQPIGPRGVEFTEKLRSLDGKRVRILGYMARQSQPVARCFLLSPVPLALHEDEYGFAEDMPATVMHVFTDPTTPAAVTFTPGLLLLTGTLTMGNRIEPDDRVSTVRLQLDPPTAEQRTALKDLPGSGNPPSIDAAPTSGANASPAGKP
jgi:hypothetical protein